MRRVIRSENTCFGNGTIAIESACRGMSTLLSINHSLGCRERAFRQARFLLLQHRPHVHQAFALIAETLGHDAVVEGDVGSPAAQLPDLEGSRAFLLHV